MEKSLFFNKEKVVDIFQKYGFDVYEHVHELRIFKGRQWIISFYSQRGKFFNRMTQEHGQIHDLLDDKLCYEQLEMLAMELRDQFT